MRGKRLMDFAGVYGDEKMYVPTSNATYIDSEGKTHISKQKIYNRLGKLEDKTARLNETEIRADELCPDCKDKDHQIAVLEKAIYLLAYYTPCDRCPIGKYKCKGGQDCENQLKQYFIKQAEKELEGKE